MTIEITEFRCQTCGQMLGEEEYRLACSKLNKDMQEAREELRKDLTIKHQREMQLKDTQHAEEMQRKEEEHESHIQGLVDQGVQNRIDSLEEKHQQEIRKKDEEIDSIKSQWNLHLDEMIADAVKNNNEKHEQENMQTQLYPSRIEKENKSLVEQAEKMRQTIENIPPEFRGTVGELLLIEELRAAFPHDDLISKKVGVEMPDVVQTIVTESGEKNSYSHFMGYENRERRNTNRHTKS